MKTKPDTSAFPMHYNAPEVIQRRAKRLRKPMTEAEKILWNEIRNRKIVGFKFRRQHPVEQFIADFYCHEKQLVIELDGEIHNRRENKEYDENRTAELEKYGIKVIRFTNQEVLNKFEAVKEKIEQVLTSSQPSPNRKGE